MKFRKRYVVIYMCEEEGAKKRENNVESRPAKMKRKSLHKGNHGIISIIRE